MRRARVKICGITRSVDGIAAAEFGAAMIGLNFYPPSPRCVDLETASEIVGAVRRRRRDVRVVGVFVDPDPEEVARCCRELDLDLVQLHGDEPPELAQRCRRLAGSEIIKALRLEPEEIERQAFRELTVPYSRYGPVLLEAAHPDLYGGTGRSWSYPKLGSVGAGIRIIMAGGITADNVGRALGTGAWGVDACSGIESSPGIKDHRLMRRLLTRAGVPA